MHTEQAAQRVDTAEALRLADEFGRTLSAFNAQSMGLERKCEAMLRTLIAALDRKTDDLAAVLADRDALQAEAELWKARYRWMRAAWLEGANTGEDPVQLRAIAAVYTEAEMDAAIDAELAKAGA